MKRKSKTREWHRKHINDTYVQKAQESNYRSRAAFKLIELNNKDRFLNPNKVILDLGSAPGSWSQIVSEKINNKGKIIAVDILDMDSIPGVDFIKGNFLDQKIQDSIADLLNNKKADVILSDMAPNLTGVKNLDQCNMIEIIEQLLEFTEKMLDIKGTLVLKLFHGGESSEVIAKIKKMFKIVKIRKPDASRDKSTEAYVVAKELRG